MSNLKILDWIDPDEGEQITLADIQFASRDAADYIEELEAERDRMREALEEIAGGCIYPATVAREALAGGE